MEKMDLKIENFDVGFPVRAAIDLVDVNGIRYKFYIRRLYTV